MATVFLAEDERLGRQVAVKRLHADSPADTARRFGREARIGASLNHPNLVTVFDTVTEDETVLIVMEYVEGESLGEATGAARSTGSARRASSAASRLRSITPTNRASFTATSSPRTSCWGRTGQ